MVAKSSQGRKWGRARGVAAMAAGGASGVCRTLRNQSLFAPQPWRPLPRPPPAVRGRCYGWPCAAAGRRASQARPPRRGGARGGARCRRARRDAHSTRSAKRLRGGRAAPPPPAPPSPRPFARPFPSRPSDLARGEKIFKTKCAQCHVAEKGGGHKQVREGRGDAPWRAAAAARGAGGWPAGGPDRARAWP